MRSTLYPHSSRAPFHYDHLPDSVWSHCRPSGNWASSPVQLKCPIRRASKRRVAFGRRGRPMPPSRAVEKILLPLTTRWERNIRLQRRTPKEEAQPLQPNRNAVIPQESSGSSGTNCLKKKRVKNKLVVVRPRKKMRQNNRSRCSTWATTTWTLWEAWIRIWVLCWQRPNQRSAGPPKAPRLLLLRKPGVVRDERWLYIVVLHRIHIKNTFISNVFNVTYFHEGVSPQRRRRALISF